MYENIPILMKEKQLKFAIVSINPNSVTKTENKVTNPSQGIKTFYVEPTDPTNPNGQITRYDIFVDKSSNSYNSIGIAEPTPMVPDSQWANATPYYNSLFMFYFDGHVHHKGDTSIQYTNSPFGDKIRLAIEIDTTQKQNSAYFFIQDVEQPIFVTGFPDNVRLFLTFNNQNDGYTVLSVGRIQKLSIKHSFNKIPIRW
ncbi:MAG: hypothetical protein EZS28_011707 [Streblomastix strix]|uniref:Uncharacterized protein n=1 Tax=Streblomastix strix TaxID=222440 RepID=A0A5J4WCS8_9EUKA|nr:MAG: hypothetical protein EZS28_011707 [Streblomastix strix]